MTLLNRDQFLASIEDETKILKHLATKVDPAKLDYRPAEGMRSTAELIGYLSFCASGTTQALCNDDWSRIGEAQEATKDVTHENFAERLDQQLESVKASLGTVSDEDFATKECNMPWGTKGILGPCLVDMPLKFLAAYRLQLFAYLKQSGQSELNTMNAWMGMDA